MTLTICLINQEDKALYRNDARLYFFYRNVDKGKCRNLEMLPWGQFEIKI